MRAIQNKNMRTKTGELTAYAFICGDVEGVGEHTEISMEDSVYQIKRHTSHPQGSAWEEASTLSLARRKARALEDQE